MAPAKSPATPVPAPAKVNATPLERYKSKPVLVQTILFVPAFL
ncbi:hypothetical protein REL07_003690 [Clostridioides difficile]|nr:hypothetical protein [Clostridioides difficile]MCZ8504146.1 hypothetical protein [Clostridioides difficile]MDC2921136.1 hypothetical protein [Clostridioides difficile]MDE3514046.1 hypothetical protein [Clostridioides difficile]MDI2787204.1 hypothetical protein [Clostridioides difficile]MDI6128912.1 hypothetical protein [Clostridioides difficile]